MNQEAMQRATLVAILILTLYRAVLAFFDQTELSTDDTEDRFWGQSFDVGTYSKPPLIGWILGLATELLGQTVAAVRLPAGVFHGATVLLVFQIAAQLGPPPFPCWSWFPSRSWFCRR
jgi:4-amino-4-deoxy-L-arabinose transferase-like glycosyltransferase